MINQLACTICQRPAFAKLSVEIDTGSATYIVCTNSTCITQASQRAADNLWRAASKVNQVSQALEAHARELPG